MHSSAWNWVSAHLEEMSWSSLSHSKVATITNREIEIGVTQIIAMLFSRVFCNYFILILISYISQQYQEVYSDLAQQSTFIPTSPESSKAQITEHMPKDSL